MYLGVCIKLKEYLIELMIGVDKGGKGLNKDER